MNADLRKDADKNPLWHAAIVWLFAVGIASLPSKYLFLLFIKDQTVALYASQISVRFLLSAAAFFLIRAYGFTGLIKKPVGLKGLLACMPAFIVAVNNFPIIGVLIGEVIFFGTPMYIALYILDCLFIGLFEESVFRGIIFPLIFIKFKDKKRAAFISAFISSAVFALTHIVNIFASAGLAETVLQIGYSFLIGGLCALSVLKTGSIFPAAFIHFIYDVGGLLLSSEYKIAEGFQWDTITVIITAVIGVAVATFEIIYAYKSDGEKLRKTLILK